LVVRDTVHRLGDELRESLLGLRVEFLPGRDSPTDTWVAPASPEAEALAVCPTAVS
jgi:hypothetical protein